jgi:hypothetical protein
MPGDPHQCRRNAARCLALAQRARKPETRQNFTLMAETWEKLAAESQSDQALLAALHELELYVQNSHSRGESGGTEEFFGIRTGADESLIINS